MNTTRISLRTALIVLLTAGTVTLAGCVVATEPEENMFEEDTSSSSDAILNGTSVTEKYPEAATIDVGTSPLCSGTLIAPMVVLTAGHCVLGSTTLTVKVGAESRTTTGSAVYDWTSGSSKNPAQHDVALLFLSKPIWLMWYPTIEQTAVLANTPVTNVGRIHNGPTSTLWGADVYDLNDGTMIGAPPPYSGTFAFDYWASNVLEKGDSGGPVFIKDTHRIIAVNSAVATLGNGKQIGLLARVDLLHGWIMQQIAARPAPAPTNAQISCVFNWAESAYSNLFSPPAPGVLLPSPPYMYRYYPGTNSYLGAAWASASAPHQAVASSSSTYPVKHVFFMGPSGVAEDQGTVGYWMKQANCL
ncbi:trypsin-like serine protease [Polyangium fumosum]|uniref:Trypsin-like serine protease n=1 Tax=Polyangium fumosum TaxID=889272 RepID=A0A4U1IWK2_9BACT|nr:trypsin-like serine protease [Polyangium fumosum]TKC98849.1 trypsin-like serine protease [Polyangium fumosum]